VEKRFFEMFHQIRDCGENTNFYLLIVVSWRSAHGADHGKGRLSHFDSVAVPAERLQFSLSGSAFRIREIIGNIHVIRF
jgi:hypothetical protein